MVSGDGWSFQADGDRASVIVADGLGHGPVAAEASDAALAVFALRPAAGPEQLLTVAHEALRSTRGAAVAVAVLDAEAGTLVFCGAGNIAGRLISGIADRSLLSQHGTVGLQIRRLADVSYAQLNALTRGSVERERIEISQIDRATNGALRIEQASLVRARSHRIVQDIVAADTLPGTIGDDDVERPGRSSRVGQSRDIGRVIGCDQLLARVVQH